MQRKDPPVGRSCERVGRVVGQTVRPPRSWRQNQAQVRRRRRASRGGVPRPRARLSERGPFRDRLRRPHAVRQARRRPRRPAGDRARRDRDPRGARPRRRRGRRGRVRDHGPGAPGRRRPGAGAAGCGRRRPADRAAGRHDQQGLRLEHPGGRDRRPDDPLGRPQRGRRGRDGVDVERAVRAEEGAVRLPARRRRADRPDGPRRADVDLRRPAHGRAGVVRLARARDHARGAGRVGAALARARGRGAGRGALRRRDRPGRRGHGGRGPAPRHDAREAGGAEAGLRPGGDDDRRERPGRERRRRRARRHERGVREEARARGAGDDPRPGLRRRRVRLPGADARRRRARSRSTRPARRSAT